MKRLWPLALALALTGCGDGGGSAQNDLAVEEPAKGTTAAPDDFYAPPPPPPPPQQETPPPPPPPPPQDAGVSDLLGEALAELAPPPPPPPAGPTADQLLAARLEQEAAERAARMAAYRAVVARGTVRPPPVPPPAAPQEPVKGAMDKDYSSLGQTAKPSTRPVDASRMIRMGSLVPAVTRQTINSQLPGSFLAYVELPYYAADGRAVVFPKGTEIFCRYKSLRKQGDSRLPVECPYATRPDGVRFDLEKAGGADQAGRTGFVGRIDSRIWDRYGDAFVMAGLAVGAGYASGRVTDPALKDGVSSGIDRLADVTSQVLREQLDLAPILTITPGDRVLIAIDVDLWLAEPKAATDAGDEE